MEPLISLVGLRISVSAAEAVSTVQFRGEFEITGVSGTCSDQSVVGTAGELRFQQFADGTGLVFSERSQVRAYFLPSDTFNNTLKPVQTTFMRYGFGPVGHPVSVRVVTQVPANIAATTMVIHVTGEVAGVTTPGCTAKFLGELATWIN